MSGTSVDGIDVACVDLELDGDELGCGYRGVSSVPFDATLRDRIVAALPPGEPGAGELCQLHAELGHAYADAFAAAAGRPAGWLAARLTSPCCTGRRSSTGSTTRAAPWALLATPLLLPRRDRAVRRERELAGSAARPAA